VIGSYLGRQQTASNRDRSLKGDERMAISQQIAELDVLNEAERECVSVYVDRLREALGADLREVWVFGSVARGAIWYEGIGIRSDIDLLVVTGQAPSDARKDELINLTYDLFLACGRQIAPAFVAAADLASPSAAERRAFLQSIAKEKKRIYP
jgi:predicted nucleotidyltransferase